MGAIEDQGGARFALPLQLTVGRSAVNLLRIPDPAVSASHSIIAWLVDRWTLRDMGSRNGTFIDGVRLDKRKGITPIVRGQTISFGRGLNAFRLVDEEPPDLVAFEETTGRLAGAIDGVLALPPSGPVEWVISVDEAGRTLASRQEEQQVLDDGAVLHSASGGRWRIFVPGLIVATALTDSIRVPLESLRICFQVTPDEERCRLVLRSKADSVTLEHREHAYVLLTLARRMEKGDGWVAVGELESMFPDRPGYVDVAIHRARRQLAAAGVEGAGAIVEVRRGARRFGSIRFEIEVVEF